MMNEETLRLWFEKWADSYGLCLDRDGDWYMDEAVDYAWLAAKALNESR